MTSDRILRVCQVALVSLALVVPAVMFVSGTRSPLIDNRELTIRPNVVGTGLFDTTVTDQFDRYLDDGFPLRDEAVKLDARLAQVLGDSSNTSVRLGRAGWLFLRPEPQTACLDPAIARSALERLGNVFDSVDKQVVVVVAPDKASIFVDRYGNDADLQCTLSTAAGLGQIITNIPFITAWDATREVAATDSSAYRRLDTHWSNVGAAPTAQRIVDYLKPGLWDAESLSMVDTTDSPGDLAAVLGRPETEQEVISISDPSDGQTEASSLLVLDRNGESVEERFARSYRSTWLAAIDETTLFLGDSFGYALRDLVGPYFAHLDAIDGLDVTSLDMQPLLREADLVIREQVQRDFVRDVVDDDLAAQFAVAFADRLDSIAVDVVCDDDGCRTVSQQPAGAVRNADTYIVARLANGVESAQLSVGGHRQALDLDRPAAGWHVSSARIQIDGDSAAVTWSVIRVPRG